MIYTIVYVCNIVFVFSFAAHRFLPSQAFAGYVDFSRSLYSIDISFHTSAQPVKINHFCFLFVFVLNANTVGSSCGRCVHRSFTYCRKVYDAVIVASVRWWFGESKSIAWCQSTQ